MISFLWFLRFLDNCVKSIRHFFNYFDFLKFWVYLLLSSIFNSKHNDTVITSTCECLKLKLVAQACKAATALLNVQWLHHLYYSFLSDVIAAGTLTPNMWNINKYENLLSGRLILCFRNIIIIVFTNWIIKLILFQNKIN